MIRLLSLACAATLLLGCSEDTVIIVHGEGGAPPPDGTDAGGGGDSASAPDAGNAKDSAGPPADTAPPNDGTAEQLCVDTINMYRATLSLPPYTRWKAEETCGDGQAKSDSMTMTAHGAFGMCSESAQNECPGWPGPPSAMITDCLAQMWAEGPGADFSKHGHYINMSSSSYSTVACGFYTLSDGSVWAVQDFQ